MHPARAAFLVWLAALSAFPALAIEIGSRVSAEGGVAAGRDIQARDIIIGLTPVQVQELMRELFAQESAAIHKVEELSRQLGVTDAAMKRFFVILGEREVPVEELPDRLGEIATRHKNLLSRVEGTVSSDPQVQARREEAKAAIEAGEYNRAERLLNEAKDAAIGAARRLKEDLETQLLAAAEAAAENGALAMTRLRYREAAAYFAEAVDLLPEGSDAVRADYLNQQGEAAGDGGDYPAAVQAHRRALDIRERIHAPDNPEVAESLNNLALLYQATGRYAEAEPLFERALSIREKVLGLEHPDVAESLNNLAGLHQATGRYAEAEPLYQRALTIWEKILGPEHPDVAISLNNLALLYWTTGRYAEAEPLYQRALAICEKAFGPEHPDVALSLNNLAKLYRNTGRHGEAEPLYQRAIAILEKTLPLGHPRRMQVREDYAVLLNKLGRHAEAAALRDQAGASADEASR